VYPQACIVTVSAVAGAVSGATLQVYANYQNGAALGSGVGMAALTGGVSGATAGLMSVGMDAVAIRIAGIGLRAAVAGGTAAVASAAEEVGVTGNALSRTSSLYDTSITRAGSQYLNVQTDVGMAEFQQNLISNGFNVAKQTPGTTVLNNGVDTWTVYTRTSTGAPGAQFFGGNGSIIKYSLGGP
jgi:hypothetical protein